MALPIKRKALIERRAQIAVNWNPIYAVVKYSLRLRQPHSASGNRIFPKQSADLSLCILSGEIGGGSTEAWICLGISVFGRCFDAMASEVLTVCCSLNPTVKTMSISLPSVRDHFSFFSWTYILDMNAYFVLRKPLLLTKSVRIFLWFWILFDSPCMESSWLSLQYRAVIFSFVSYMVSLLSILPWWQSFVSWLRLFPW